MKTAKIDKKDQLGDLLDIYKKGNELELRFYIDNDAFYSSYNNALKEQTVSFITEVLQFLVNIDSGDTTDKQEVFFKDGVSQKIEDMRKTRVSHFSVNKFPGYQLSLATEEKKNADEKVQIDKTDFERFKLRASLFIGNWKMDFTLVKNIPKNKLADKFYVKAAKEKIFPKREITVENFVDFTKKIYDDQTDKMELEAEFVDSSGKNPITKEELKKEIDFIVEKIRGWINPNYEELSKYREYFEIVKKYIPIHIKTTRQNIKYLLNQPIDINQENYCFNILSIIENFYLADKTDGERCLVCYTGKEKIALTTSEVFIETFETKSVSIFDTELYMFLDESNLEHKERKQFYIFDILVANNKDVSKETYNERLKQISKTIKSIGDSSLFIKTQTQLTSDNYKTIIDNVWTEKNKKYMVDGLIFTEDSPYEDMKVYKWKPPENQTIDFLIKSPPKDLKLPEKSGYEIFLLFCGVKYQTFKRNNMKRLPRYSMLFEQMAEDYFPIQFAPAANPKAYLYYHKYSSLTKNAETLNGHIGEFGWDFKNSQWILKKMRPDKDLLIKTGTYGNNFEVAEAIFNNYKNPLSIEKLKNTDVSKCGYFAEKKDPRYGWLTKFNNFVKAQLIRQLEKSDWIMDLGGGRGSDFLVYHGFQIQNLVVLDSDPLALEELIKRKEYMGQKDYYIWVPPAPKSQNINVYTIESDLQKPAKVIQSTVEKKIDIPYVNGITCMFALHYFITSENSAENIYNLVDFYLKPGGVFIFTCFDGQKIHTLLSQVKQYDMNDDRGLKYSIKKLYPDNDSFAVAGQKISVIHPFSQGQYYEEYLVNISHFILTFTSNGYKVIQNSSFGDWLPKFQYASTYYKNLSQQDKQYASLYQYVTLMKPI